MLKPLIKWFHLSTMHAMGSTRLLNTIARNFYHPMDSIGEWKITIGSVKISVAGLTMIDPVTNILEIARYPESKINGTNCKDLFENTWLSRYPRPI